MVNSSEIENIKNIIVSEYHPDKIILFGSYARGDNKPDSDIDILVISDREKHLPRPKRGSDIRLKLAGINQPLDILFYTHHDFEKFKSVRQSLNSAIRMEGILLYG